VDGFGCHVGKTTETGNVFRNCRAWRNSDDGFDLINCATPRDAEGNLPEMDFLVAKRGSALAVSGMGWLWMEDEETGVAAPVVKPDNAAGIYDLKGHKVSHARKGLYIVNGKLTILR